MFRHDQILSDFIASISPISNNLAQTHNTISSENFQRERKTQSSTRKIPIDVFNNVDNIVIYAEIPGVNKENIEIDFYNNKLTIIIDKKKPYTDDLEISEIKFGKWQRTINLPICITKPETVSLNYQNGILQILINKLTEEANKFTIRPE